jgi:RNA polymerase sigma-70 factor (ECF subfamily)
MSTSSVQLEAFTATSDDITLVRACQNGDDSAFEILVERYDGKLLRIAERITHNQEDSQDIVQETFLNAFRHLNEFRGDAQFSTWLIRIAVNQSFMKLRKQRAVIEFSIDEDFRGDGHTLPLELADWAPNPEELYKTSELRDILAKELRELRPTMRSVFVLRDIEGLSIAETAAILGVSQGTVKSRLLRARLELRERLSKYFSRQIVASQLELARGRNQRNSIRCECLPNECPPGVELRELA